MKHGQRLMAAGIIVGIWLCVAGTQAAQAQDAANSDSALPSEYDAPPSEMHPDRWPGPIEPPPKEPDVSPKTETEVLEFLQKHMKYYYDRLMQLKGKDVLAYRRALEYLEGKVRQLRAMPDEIRDAQIRNANVQVEILRAARGYHKAENDAERNDLKETLQKLLSEKFDIEQKVGEYRLQQLDEKLNQRKKKFEDRTKDREKILAEELRCWLQPPAKTAETQPATTPAEPEKTTPPETQPATQPASAPTTAPATAPATQPS